MKGGSINRRAINRSFCTKVGSGKNETRSAIFSTYFLSIFGTTTKIDTFFLTPSLSLPQYEYFYYMQLICNMEAGLGLGLHVM